MNNINNNMLINNLGFMDSRRKKRLSGGVILLYNINTDNVFI